MGSGHSNQVVRVLLFTIGYYTVPAQFLLGW